MKRLILNLLVALFAAQASAQVVTTLKSYRYDDQPLLPPNNLVLGEDGTLYGMSPYALYRWQADGSGFSILRQAGPLEGFGGSLSLSGNTLYGMGADFKVFQINTDGSGFTVIGEVLAGNSSRRLQIAYAGGGGGVVLSGNTLYGWGFKINTDGTGYGELVGFPPWDGLQDWYLDFEVSGDSYFASTSRGGLHDAGTVFRLNLDGSAGYTVNVDPGDGLGIGGWRLKAVGDTLYGYGFPDRMFKVHPDGTGYSVLSNASLPNWNRRLEHSDGAFYWATASYTNNRASWAVFKMSTNGTGFAELKRLTESNPDSVLDVLTVAGGTIYGLAVSPSGFEGVDGLDGRGGALFKMNTDGTGFAVLHEFMEVNLRPDGYTPGPLTVSDGVLYGSDFSSEGNPRVFRMNTDGTGFTPLLAESNPDACLTVSGSTLFGLLHGRPLGNDDYSNARVFRVNTDGTGLAVLKEFIPSVDGNSAFPSTGMAVSGDVLYGTIDAESTHSGHVDSGKVFKLNSDGAGHTILHTFSLPVLDTLNAVWTNHDGVLGVYPHLPELTVQGNALFGTAFEGGQFGYGTVFKMNTDGTGFTGLNHFPPETPHPRGRLTLSGDTLYGISTPEYVEGAGGTVFRVNTDGTGFIVVKQFADGIWDNNVSAYTNSDGVNPIMGLALWRNTLYGTTSRGGQFGAGTLFKVNTDGTGFAVLEHLEKGGQPWDGGGLRGLVVSGNTLYGSAPSGGDHGAGAVYRIDLTPTLSIQRTGANSLAVTDRKSVV